MGKYKINSRSDKGIFVVTSSYLKLYNKLKNLKKTKGRIIHVLGSPGTGKSTNIYAALNELNLNVYDAKFNVDNRSMDSKEVFKQVYQFMKDDFDVKSKTEVYKCLSEYDAILFADNFHDSHLIDQETIGFSLWTKNAGYNAFKFYLLCIHEYFRERNAFKDINIILQTAWRVNIRGKKYDLFSDLGILSKICVSVLRIFFEVVLISYSYDETINIVQKHVNVDERIIGQYIDKYGNKPRFICLALEKE
jgi:hypothetical protein